MSFDEYFRSLESRGIVLTAQQRHWYVKKAEILGDGMKSQYPSTPEEAFEKDFKGLYYASHVSAARSNKRILNIPQDPTLKVHTAWDLGFHDATSIIFFTIVGKEVHIIDFLETTGTSLAENIKAIKKKDYVYGTHLAPHDIKVHELSTGISRFDTAAKLGIAFTLVPNLSLADGIDNVRNMFTRLFFHNSDTCLSLVGHLENYTQKWDSTMGIWSGRPEHNQHSHAADALRYLCAGLDYCIDESQGMTQAQADAMWRTYGRKI